MEISKILSDLNSVQREAVCSFNGAFIVYAGAGTGKTRVIISRIAYLVSQGVSIENILALTFTDKASREMSERLSLYDISSKSCTFTFHAFCVPFLKKVSKFIGMPPTFEVVDESTQRSIIGDCLNSLGIGPDKYGTHTVSASINLGKDCLEDESSIVSRLVSVFDNNLKLAYDFYSSYCSYFVKHNLLDYGDLILKSVYALSTFPKVADYWQSKIKYLMVDEYQDTNHAQYVLMKLLAKKNGNVFIVGDPDQSIYGWRGADITNIDNFKSDYPNYVSMKLEQNYRSTPKILSLSHNIISSIDSRESKELWTNNPDDGGVIVHVSDSNDSEAAFVCGRVAQDVSLYNFKYSDCCILYRNKYQLSILSHYLKSKGIPFVVHGSMRFYARKEIQDVISYLRLIINVGDDENFERVINVPIRGIGKKSLALLKDYAKSNHMSLYSASFQADEISGLDKKTVSSMNDFANLVYKLCSTYRDLPLAWSFERVLSDIGYIDYLDLKNNAASRCRKDNLMELGQSIKDFASRNIDSSLSKWLEHIDDICYTSITSDDVNKLNLMTIHKAKGLEYNTVFIVGLNEGVFPNFNSKDVRSADEERRLMYVACTRAKKRLYLSCYKRTILNGFVHKNDPSRFILQANTFLESYQKSAVSSAVSVK